MGLDTGFGGLNGGFGGLNGGFGRVNGGFGGVNGGLGVVNGGFGGVPAGGTVGGTSTGDLFAPATGGSSSYNQRQPIKASGMI